MAKSAEGTSHHGATILHMCCSSEVCHSSLAGRPYESSPPMQDLQRNSGSSCGMVQSNFLGTEFTIYDRGMSGVTALSPKGD